MALLDMQVEDRGQFAIRGGLLDLFPATVDRAVRVDLFGDEIESLRWFSTFTQRSLGDADVVEVAPAAELAEEHRELAEIAALMEDGEQRPDIAEILPTERFHPLLELIPEDAGSAPKSAGKGDKGAEKAAKDDKAAKGAKAQAKGGEKAPAKADKKAKK